MTLVDIKDYLKELVDCPCWYAGRIDANQERCIGVCPCEVGEPANMAVGGAKNTTYSKRAVTLLVHWGFNAGKAEKKALAVYEALLWQQPVIAGHQVILFEMAASEPIGLGADESGIYEYKIELVIYYKKKGR